MRVPGYAALCVAVACVAGAGHARASGVAEVGVGVAAACDAAVGLAAGAPTARLPSAAFSAEPPPGGVTLNYDAYMGNAKAGAAVIRLSKTDEGYEVSGTAQSLGLLESLKRWRARFASIGRYICGVPRMLSYRLLETDDRKRREVAIDNGELTEIKNGKRRPTRPALPGRDVLTALFVDGRCESYMQMHTGRHGYDLRLEQALAADGSALPADMSAGVDTADVAACRYRITDEDDDHITAEIRFTQRHGFRVPQSIEARGFLAGRLVLTDLRAANGGTTAR